MLYYSSYFYIDDFNYNWFFNFFFLSFVSTVKRKMDKMTLFC